MRLEERLARIRQAVLSCQMVERGEGDLDFSMAWTSQSHECSQS